MNITKYELLLCAVRHNNITMAADEMNYSQSGATHMIKSLEDELGVQLLDRNRSGSRLTPEGKRLFPYFQTIVSNQQEIRREVTALKNQKQKRVTVATYISCISVYIPELFARFKEENPDAALDFQLGTPWEVDQWIEKGKAELGFVMLPVIRPKETLTIYQDRMVIVCGEDYQPDFSDDHPVTEEELSREKILTIGKSEGSYDLLRYYDNIPDMSFILCGNDTNVQLEMARENMGVAMTAAKIAEGFCGKLKVYEMEKYIPADIALIYKKGAALSPMAKEMIRILKESIALDPH